MSQAKTVGAKAKVLGVLAEAQEAIAAALAKLDGDDAGGMLAGARSVLAVADGHLKQNVQWVSAQEETNVR